MAEKRCRGVWLSGAIVTALFMVYIAGGSQTAKAERLTRFVAHLAGPANIDVFALASPRRLVIEVDREILDVPDAAAVSRSSMLSAVRFGRYTPGKWRIVVELSTPIAIARSQLVALDRTSGRHALVLDMARSDATTFKAQADRDQRRRAALSSAQDEAPAPLGLRRRADGKVVIFIDPGHGGIDSGALGQSGTKEKAVALRFAKALAAKLRRRDRYHVALSRDTDVYVPLRRRREMARAAGAQLFISVHADSLPEGSDRSVRGTTVYTLSAQGSDQVARALARRENAADQIAGVELAGRDSVVASILLDLAQEETAVRSRQLARALVSGLRSDKRRLNKRPLRSAAFAVLKAPDVPSVLLELGYLSNQRDEMLLRSPKWRAQMVASIAKAIDRHLARVVADAPF